MEDQATGCRKNVLHEEHVLLKIVRNKTELFSLPQDDIHINISITCLQERLKMTMKWTQTHTLSLSHTHTHIDHVS